jgi:LemA protein
MSVTAILVTTAVVAIIVLLWGIKVYNGLARLSNLKDEAWGGVDAQLKRRLDIVPKLVEMVRVYAKDEEGALKNAVAARNAITNAPTQDALIEAENMFANVLRELFTMTENYPDLEASRIFTDLQGKLSSLENEIQMARCYYNGTVSEYNTAIQAFPAVIISRLLSYQKAPLLDNTDLV